MPELMTVIVIWLSVNFGLPANHEHPRVKRVTEAAMLEVRRARHVSPGPDPISGAVGRPASPDTDFGVHAIYDDRDRTIYLPVGWTATSPAHVSMLVHEMVHHLQNVGETSYACPQEREKLAYDAQASWLELFGGTLADDLGIDAMTRLVRTHCLY